MKTVNFEKVVIKNIDESLTEVDLRKIIGNYIYNATTDISESEIAKKVYFSIGEIEVSEEEIEVIKRHSMNSSYFLAKTKIAINELLACE